MPSQIIPTHVRHSTEFRSLSRVAQKYLEAIAKRLVYDGSRAINNGKLLASYDHLKYLGVMDKSDFRIFEQELINAKLIEMDRSGSNGQSLRLWVTWEPICRKQEKPIEMPPVEEPEPSTEDSRQAQSATVDALLAMQKIQTQCIEASA